jgi:transposase
MSKNNKKIIRKWGRPYKKPKKENGSPEELLQWSKEAENPEEGKRYLVIRTILLEEGKIELEKVGKLYGITRKTVYRWIVRWNKEGREGLKDKPKSGRPRKFQKEHEEKVFELVNGQSEDGKRRLTIKGIHGFLKGTLSS